MSGQTGKDTPSAEFDKAGQEEIEGRKGEPEDAPDQPKAPPAGPHAEPSLTNPDATPGTGSLPDPTSDDEVDAATG